MKLYTVDPGYSGYLKQYEINVYDASDPLKASRPYAMVMVSIRQSPLMPFLVPFTSSVLRRSSRHSKQPWERCIQDVSDPTNELGMMLFSKMIPFPMKAHLAPEINIEKTEGKVKLLYLKNLEYINAFEKEINAQASSIYCMKTFMKSSEKSSSRLNACCVNYEKLEKLSTLYSASSASSEASTSASAPAEASLSAPARKREKAKAKKEEAKKAELERKAKAEMK